MTEDEMDAIVMSFPLTEKGMSYGRPSYKVNGKFFTRLRREDDSLVLLEVNFDEREMLMEAEPETFHFTAHYKDYPSVLARIARICDAQRATFIAASSLSFVGCNSFALEADCKALEPKLQAAWSQVRALAEAERVGLALPRFLLRQPYGANGEPIDAFSFEELPADLPHESFLWGNPAVLCGHVLAEAFMAEAWKATTNGFGEVGDLPVYRFKANGESKVKPCAETWMPESVAEHILANGLIPILSIKGRDAVRVGGLRSISSRGAALPLG